MIQIEPAWAAISNSEAIAWYEDMLRIRYFEDAVADLFLQGHVRGTTHLCQGQEAISVGAARATKARDVITCTYRGHGHCLAFGMPLFEAMSEILGKETGCCHGKGGSMHLTDVSRGILGSFAIVGAGLPVAAGAAWAAQLRGTDQVALTFFGDGSTNIGTFHETLNVSAVWKLPVIFICENNLYGEYSPISLTTPPGDLTKRAEVYGITSFVVDGNDVRAVYQCVAEAVRRGRDEQGPTFLEMKTYRHKGHSRSDPAKYRPEGELEEWLKRDPIDRWRLELQTSGVITDEDDCSIREKVSNAVASAVNHAMEASFPRTSEVGSHVFAD